MRAAEVGVVGGLVDANPWLMPILQEHLDDNDGVLPHLFLGDVERWAEAEVTSRGDSEELQSVLAFLENQFAKGHPHVQELIAVSFIELLPDEGETANELVGHLGPRMRRWREASSGSAHG